MTDMIVREFQAVDVGVEGRTVDVRVVPFDEVAEVSDPPHTHTYREQWMPGCFDHQLRAANRVHANVNHSQHVIDTVGHGVALRAESDGYHASFEIHETQAGETALALLRAGALPGVSLEAISVNHGRTSGGIVQRIKANLRAVAFVREGAFAGAQVLAVREAQIIDEELLPVDIDPERVQRLRAQGISLPDRYQAHPAETGTSTSVDTPGDGTRLSDANTSSEER
jgi:hypothetical protein